MGEKANYWRDELTWPLPRSQTVTYYLQSKGKANTLHGDGILIPAPPSSGTGKLHSFFA